MKTGMILSSALALSLFSLLVSCSPSTSSDQTMAAQNFSASQEGDSSIIGGIDSNSDYQKSNGIVGLLMVMQDRSQRQMSAVCTGSLISSNVVLTAAHCLTIPQGTQLVAALVFFDKNLDAIMEEISKNDYTHVRAIDKVLRHEQYLQGRGTNNDIGLVRFSGVVPSGFKIAQLAPAQMARTIRKGSSVTLAGFGVSKYDLDPATRQPVGSGDGILRQITGIRILSLTATGEEITLDQSQGRGACHGDSGGPAYLVDQVTKKIYLIGVTSRGTEAQGLCNRQAIYTGVMGYSSWISQGLQKMSATQVAATK